MYLAHTPSAARSTPILLRGTSLQPFNERLSLGLHLAQLRPKDEANQRVSARFGCPPVHAMGVFAMKNTTRTVLAAGFILALAGCNQQETGAEAPAASEAASAELLNGTWKADLQSIKFEGRPNELLLQGGTYKCATCMPPLTLAADGQFHPVADRPYFDSMSVRAVDDRTVEIRRRRDQRQVSSATLQVAADGNVLTTKFTNANNPNVAPIEGTETARRVRPAPTGAHLVSGQWAPDRVQDYSEDALNVTFRIAGGQVTMNAQGESYTAELSGPAVAMQGDAGGTMVAVTREGANGLRETMTRGGKEVGVTLIVPSADGNSITFTNTDPRDGSKATWTATKQS